MTSFIRTWVCVAWAGWDGTLSVPNVFIFVTEKEHDFRTDEDIMLLHPERKKKNLTYLNSRHRQPKLQLWDDHLAKWDSWWFFRIFSDFLYLAVTYLSIFMSCAVFWLPPQARQIQTKSENTKQCYTPMNSLLGYLWSNCFFFHQLSLLISHKAGKAKWIEKRSVRSRPVKQVFLQHKITNCTHVLYTYTQVIWTLPYAVGL